MPGMASIFAFEILTLTTVFAHGMGLASSMKPAKLHEDSLGTSAQPEVAALRSEIAIDGQGKAYAKGARISSLPRQQSLVRSGHSAIEQIAKKESDSRPALVGYEDSVCTTELGGYYLPAEPSMKDKSCQPVQHRDEEVAQAMQSMNKKYSMTWECASDWTSVLVKLHFGDNCSLGDDDTMKLTVTDVNFAMAREGGCTEATNKESGQGEYIKLLNVESIQEWPECMEDRTWIIYAGVGGGGAFIVLIMLFCWLHYRYRRHQKQKDQMWEQAMWGGGHYGGGWGENYGGKGYGKGKGKFKGKGKKDKPSWEGPQLVQPAPGPMNIKVTIVKAKSLRAADITGSSDPFVECEVVGKKEKKFKTPVVKTNLNPEWKHSQGFSAFEKGDVLLFTVKDEDLGGTKSDVLGKATVQYDQIFPNGFSSELALEDAGDAKDAKLVVKIKILLLDNEYEAKVDQTVASLGFAPSGMPPDPIFVDHVNPGSFAADANVSVGDQLVRLDGDDVEEMEQKDFIKAMQKRPVNLIFRKRPKE